MARMHSRRLHALPHSQWKRTWTWVILHRVYHILQEEGIDLEQEEGCYGKDALLTPACIATFSVDMDMPILHTVHHDSQEESVDPNKKIGKAHQAPACI